MNKWYYSYILKHLKRNDFISKSATNICFSSYNVLKTVFKNIVQSVNKFQKLNLNMI